MPCKGDRIVAQGQRGVGAPRAALGHHFDQYYLLSPNTEKVLGERVGIRENVDPGRPQGLLPLAAPWARIKRPEGALEGGSGLLPLHKCQNSTDCLWEHTLLFTNTVTLRFRLILSCVPVLPIESRVFPLECHLDVT